MLNTNCVTKLEITNRDLAMLKKYILLFVIKTSRPSITISPPVRILFLDFSGDNSLKINGINRNIGLAKSDSFKGLSVAFE